MYFIYLSVATLETCGSFRDRTWATSSNNARSLNTRSPGNSSQKASLKWMIYVIMYMNLPTLVVARSTSCGPGIFCAPWLAPTLGSKAGIVHSAKGQYWSTDCINLGHLAVMLQRGFKLDPDFSLQEWLHNLQGSLFKNYETPQASDSRQ